MANEGLMVSVSGIRGRVGEGLTPEVVGKYAAAFGAWGKRRGKGNDVVVGRDSRVSGEMFHRVVLSALQSVGCNVIDIGLTTTPTTQLAVEHHLAYSRFVVILELPSEGVGEEFLCCNVDEKIRALHENLLKSNRATELRAVGKNA